MTRPPEASGSTSTSSTSSEREARPTYLIQEDGGTTLGEPPELVELAIERGILTPCGYPDGECPISQHRGSGFVHFVEGKEWDKYASLEAAS
jgi:hypothetical protein